MTRWAREAALVLGILLVGFAILAAVGFPSIATPTENAVAPSADRLSGLPTIASSALPPEARTTLDRIASGGPFPHEADGSVFQNRERLLPIRASGTYREYTVETPGSTDRGPRRIVVASSGERYWTADHYASFARILP